MCIPQPVLGVSFASVGSFLCTSPLLLPYFYWNSCLAHSNPLVRGSLRADWQLAFIHHCEHCWVNELFRFLELWAPTFAHHMRDLQTINEAQVCRAWCATDISQWTRLTGYLPEALGEDEDFSRVESAYHNFFALPPATWSSWSDSDGHRYTDRPPLPRYLCVRLSRSLYVALARFRLSAHHLTVVRGRWASVPYLFRTCPLEPEDSLYYEVQDGVHAAFRCQFPPVVQLREEFPALFERIFYPDDLRQFINCPNASQVALSISQLLDLCEGTM